MSVKKLGLVIVLVLVFVSISAASVLAEPPTCNWGELTSDAIAAGFDQGGHSSDPSDDGKGPDDADHRRAGLANVAAKGDLEATCEFIASLPLPLP